MFKVISLETFAGFVIETDMEDSCDKLNFLYLDGDKKAEVADVLKAQP